MEATMRRYALRPFREDWRDSCGDEWGATMGHWFGIAEVLHHAGADLPGEWQFRHGMSDDDPIRDYHSYDQPCSLNECNEWCTDRRHECCECTEERYYVPYLDAGERGIEMLTYAGRVIDRYAGRLQRAGRDY